MESQKKKRFVCVMIWRRNLTTEEIEFLVINSVSTDPTTGIKSGVQTKFPGGCERLPDEPIEMTGRREVLEETYLAFTQFEEIWKKKIPEPPREPEHTKYGLLVRFADCRGELRKDVLIDNGDEMSPPYWASVTTLKYQLFPGHQSPFLKAMEHLGLLKWV